MNQEVRIFSSIGKSFPNKFEMLMPKNTQLLFVDVNVDNIICIGGLVYPHQELETRYFELFSTGDKIHNDMGIERKYVGSYKLDNGKSFRHIFERVN